MLAQYDKLFAPSSGSATSISTSELEDRDEEGLSELGGEDNEYAAYIEDENDQQYSAYP